MKRSEKKQTFHICQESGSMKVKNIGQNTAFIPQVKEFKEKYEGHSKLASSTSAAIYQKSIDLAN